LRDALTPDHLLQGFNDICIAEEVIQRLS
jgi:hypothetical protein